VLARRSRFVSWAAVATLALPPGNRYAAAVTTTDDPTLDPPPAGRRRRRTAILIAVVLALFAVDQLQAPERQLSARALLAGIRLYQRGLSPQMPKIGIRCRFTPTCSHYAAGAIEKHGALRGGLRAAGRLARCGPWTPAGTVDPP
jgi:putative membrane protein insertion efficiency factor